MDASPIPGFITRRQASERCQRAERTLQRYWSQAIEHRDTSVLEHLKLRGEDGQTVEGPSVTKEMIEELKRSGQNPTWYVHAEWVEKTYGPRSDDDAQPTTKAKSQDAVSALGGEPTVLGGGDSRLLTVLEEQLRKRDKEIDRLHAELDVKNEQIRDANARTRESNVLMQDLQKMLRDWQQQAFRSLPAPSPLAPEVSTHTSPPEKSHETTADAARKRQEGSRRKRAAKPSSPSTTIDKAQPAQPAEKRQPTALEKHTPTLHKAFTRLFRR